MYKVTPLADSGAQEPQNVVLDSTLRTGPSSCTYCTAASPSASSTALPNKFILVGSVENDQGNTMQGKKSLGVFLCYADVRHLLLSSL